MAAVDAAAAAVSWAPCRSLSALSNCESKVAAPGNVGSAMSASFTFPTADSKPDVAESIDAPGSHATEASVHAWASTCAVDINDCAWSIAS
jgi:hypothetical protein